MKIFYLILCAALISSVAWAEEDLVPQSCGTNCLYTLDSNGHLTVFPEDESKDAVIRAMAFLDNKNINSVDIQEGVTEIQRHAFCNTSLSELNLPNSLKIIRDSAFKETSLPEVSLPKNLEYLGGQVFFNTNITELIFPESLKTLEPYALMLGNSDNAGTAELKYIFPASMTEFKENSFYIDGGWTHIPPEFYAETEEQRNAILEMRRGAKVFVYQETEDGVMVSQNGRELYKYDSKRGMLDDDWKERYEYSDDKKYGGLRQEAYVKDGDGEKYIGAKIFRPDGSIVLVDENNKFINKLHAKIYTVEEAMAATRDGNVNHVRLTYK